MQTIRLGRTGLNVTRLGVGGGGASQLGRSTGISAGESISIVRMALEAGVNFIDTAEVYGTEEIVGQAIKAYKREKVYISTKKSVGNEKLILKTDLRVGLEASLKMLGTDYVDVYNLHGVTVEQYDYLAGEIVPEMTRLREEGKIRFLGVTELFGSDTGHAMLTRALQDDFWDVFMVGFNLINQSARARVFQQTIEKDIGVLIMFAVRRALSQPDYLVELVSELVEKGQVDPGDIDLENPLGFLVEDGYAESVPDAAYRFCRDESGTHVILSGTGSLEHMSANIRSIEATPLRDEATERLRSIFRRVDSVSG